MYDEGNVRAGITQPAELQNSQVTALGRSSRLLMRREASGFDKPVLFWQMIEKEKKEFEPIPDPISVSS